MELTFLLLLVACFLFGCLVGALLISVVMVKFQDTDFDKEMGRVNRKLDSTLIHHASVLTLIVQIKRDLSLLQMSLRNADSIVLFKTPEPEQVGQLGEHQVPEEG